MAIAPKKINPNFLDDLFARRSGVARCGDHPEFVADKCALCQPASPDAELLQGDRVAVWQSRVREEWESGVPHVLQPAKADHASVVEWATNTSESPREGRSLFILGATGVGKSWQAYGALKRVLWQERKITWQAIGEAELLGVLRPHPLVHPEEMLAKYRTADVLLIDDFGSSNMSGWVEEITYRIVNYRYEHVKPTIFTSNLVPAKVREVVGDRVASRLSAMCDRAILDGPDRRRT